MDGSQGGMTEAPLSAADVRRFLSDNPEFLTADQGLLDELGLKVAQGNVVDFGPAALARVHAAHLREATQRREIEETRFTRAPVVVGVPRPMARSSIFWTRATIPTWRGASICSPNSGSASPAG